jgi:protein tyrosine phosphatase
VLTTYKVTKGSETREVFHYHFMAWPDHNVPDDTQQLLDMSLEVRKIADKDPTIPIVVHCR